MKKLIWVSVLMLCLSGICFADYLGSWKIGDYVTITATTHQFSTGAAYAATGNVTYSIYEDSGTTQLVDVNAMTAFDSITGLYLGRQPITTALGFEAGKHYTVLIKATVDSVAGIVTHNFQINAAVDVNTVVGEEPADATDRFDHIDANNVTIKANIATAQSDITDILADTGAIEPIVTDIGGLSEIGDKVVADMDVNSLLVNWTLTRANILTDLAGISEIGDKIVADMDVNGILADLAGISQIGDKIVADMDVNSLLVNWTLARANIVTDLGGISEIGDKVVADMDVNGLLANWTLARANIITDLAGFSELGDKIQADMDANSLLKNWTAAKAAFLDMKVSDVNDLGYSVTATISAGDIITLVDAFWDELLSGHLTAETVGWYLKKAAAFKR